MWIPACIPFGALLLSCAVIGAVGRDPLAALGAMLAGAFGTGYGIASVAAKACPLILIGLAIVVAFRSGFWNIGAEGQLIVGAMAAGALGVVPHLPPVLHHGALLVAAAIGGAIWCALAAWLRVRRGALEVISTILLNFVALYLLSWLVHGPLMQASGAQPIGDPIAATARLPRLFGPAYSVHAGIVFALAALVFVSWFSTRTETGFRLRMVGSSPTAAAWAGMRTDRAIFAAAALSGALAGLAGAIEVMGPLGRLYDKITPGYGFTGIAVAMLARLRPWAVLPSAIFFAALETGASRMQQEADVSHVLVLVIQAVVILASIATGHVLSGRNRWNSSKAS
jgi:simple sugar transport system permease protein